MSKNQGNEALQFSCPFPNCGRRFQLQEKLNTHIQSRHPEFALQQDSKKIESQKPKDKTNIKPKSKNQAQLKPINIQNQVPKAQNILNNIQDMNKDVIKKEIEPVQQNEIENNDKKENILTNLYNEINNLQSKIKDNDKEEIEHFEVPNVPDYDKMYDSDDDEDESSNKRQKKAIEYNNNSNSSDENSKDKDKIDEKDNKKRFFFFKPEKKSEEEDDEVITEITEDLIGLNTKYRKYYEIKELNLSNKKIKIFDNKRDINFKDLFELNRLDLSYNKLTKVLDVKYIPSLTYLNIKNNKINDLSFLEFLPNLLELNCENNLINSITCLNLCNQILTLKIANNKVIYLNSTIKTLENLKKLEELTIDNNPFLDEIIGYRLLFINKFQNLKRLDNEEIMDKDKEKANEFTDQNAKIAGQITDRPFTARNNNMGINNHNKEDLKEIENEINADDNDNDEENINENKDKDKDIKDNFAYQTQTQFRIGNTVIYNNNVHIPKDLSNTNKNSINKSNNSKSDNTINDISNSNNNKLKLINKKKLPQINQESKELYTLRGEKANLKQILLKQQDEIDSLEKKLDDISKLNKEYENAIQQLKNENDEYTKNLNSNNNDEIEKNKLKEELEMWKKSYCDLLNNVITSQSTVRNNKENIKNYNKNKIITNFTNELLKNKEEYIPVSQSIDIRRNRPQTARVRTTKSTDFERILEEINNIKSQKIDEEEEEGNENINSENEEGNKSKDDSEIIKPLKDLKDIKENKENKENDVNLLNNEEEENDDDDSLSNDSFDEMCRKSFADIKEMRKTLKDWGEEMDKIDTRKNAEGKQIKIQMNNNSSTNSIKEGSLNTTVSTINKNINNVGHDRYNTSDNFTLRGNDIKNALAARPVILKKNLPSINTNTNFSGCNNIITSNSNKVLKPVITQKGGSLKNQKK